MPMPLSRMTVFASLGYHAGWDMLLWGLHSVNHRYLDVTVKTNESFRYLEYDVGKRVKQ